MIKLLMTFCLIFMITVASASEADDIFKRGKIEFAEGNYLQAKESFSKVLEIKSVKDPIICYWLGKTYIAIQDYAKAYDMLTYYKSNYMGPDSQGIEKVITLLKNETVIADSQQTYFTLGYLPDYFNSSYNDSSPILSLDGNTIYFTSDRKAAFKGENIWKSEKKHNTWRNPVIVEKLSSNFNESLGSISHSEAYIFGNYQSKNRTGDIYRSSKNGSSWDEPREIASLNTKFVEMHPYVFNGTIIFFTTVRKDCIGGSDIYVSEKKNGVWSEPENLGPFINTTDYEQTPFFDWDGRTLYFASNGHPGIGGFDIFKSHKTGDSWQDWSEPENLGLRINSVRDDRCFFRVQNSDVGFISSNRFGGRGAEDIYAINLNKIELPYEVQEEKPRDEFKIFGNVFCKKINPAELQVKDFTWKYYKDGKMYRESIQVDSEGNYELKVLSGAQEYSYLISAGSCWTVEEVIHISKSIEYEHDIELQLLEIGQTYTIDNIYFEFGKATLTENSFPTLDKLALTLNNSKDMMVEIAGHTDNIDTDEYNMQLSRDRAQSVVDYLINLDVSKDRLQAIGYGESMPIASNDTPKGREQNRRVEMKFSEYDEEMTKNERLQDELIKVKQELNELKKKSTITEKPSKPKIDE